MNVTFSASFLAAGVLDTVVNSAGKYDYKPSAPVFESWLVDISSSIDEKFRIPPQRNMSIPKRAVVDYSSPNIAKAGSTCT